MTLTTSTITGRVPLPSDSAPKYAEVVFTLTKLDTEGDQVIPGGAGARFVLDANGDMPAGATLWRNTEGLRATAYRMQINWTEFHRTRGTVDRSSDAGLVQVGDLASYTIAQLINSTPVPVPENVYWSTITQAEYDAAIAAVLEAQGSAASAASDADRAELARDLAADYAGVPDNNVATSVAGLPDASGLADDVRGYVSGSGDDDIDGLYDVQSGVWVRIGGTGLGLKVNKSDGFKKSSGEFPQIVDANGIELLGFDSEGRAILRVSEPTVQDITAALADKLLRVRNVAFPSINDAAGVELFGFDDLGRARFAVSPDVVSQVLAGVDIGATYDPVAGGLLPSSDILLLGDSMSTSTIASAIATALGGRTVSVLQKGGHDAYSMAVIMGVIPLTVTLAGNEIPASGGVAVTAKSRNILSSGGTNTGTANVTISGVEGVLSTDPSGNWTFTRSAAGAAVTVVENVVAVLNPTTGTSFIPATDAYVGRTIVIWLGRNGSKTTRVQRTGSTLEPLRLIAEAFTPRCKRIVFITPYNQQRANEPSGSAGYTSIMTLGEEMRRELGPYVLDMRSAAVKNAIYDIGDTPDSTDLADMAADCIPARYFTDPTHVNATLQAWQGAFIGNYLRAIGY